MAVANGQSLHPPDWSTCPVTHPRRVAGNNARDVHRLSKAPQRRLADHRLSHFWIRSDGRGHVGIGQSRRHGVWKVRERLVE